MPDLNAFGHLFLNPAGRSGRLVASSVQVEMIPFHHDMAKIVLRGLDDTDSSLWATGSPVRIQWGRVPVQIATFVGYVLSTSRYWNQVERAGTRTRNLEVWAIGASFPLRGGLTGSWSNQTSGDIAIDIATRHRFSIETTRTPVPWPLKTAGGVSEWTFLCEMAKSDGLICAMNQTQLRFTSPTALLDRGDFAVPVFFEKDSGRGQTVLDFCSDNAALGGGSGRSKATRILATLDAATGRSVVAQDSGPSRFLASRPIDPIFTEYPLDVVARDQLSADARMTAAGVANRFPVRATATLAGDVRVVQHSPIVIEGLGPRDSGVWQVLSVKHKIGWQSYALDVELGRDSDYDTKKRPALRPTPVSALSTAPPVLVNGAWRSATRSVVA